MALDFSFPRRPVFEVYLNSQWRNLTTSVRQKPAITITRGSKDESSQPSPALCKLTLDDTNHDFSPTDPMGAYFGTDFINAPARLALEVGQDAFTRSTGSGWGTSPQNGSWSAGTNGTASSSVSSNEGRHSITSTVTYQFNTLTDVQARDIEVRVSVTVDSVSSVTGGTLEPANIILRGQSSLTDFYLCRMSINTSNQVQLSIMRKDTTTISSTVILPTAYSGQQWRVAASIEGRWIRFKAWPAASAEPLDWQVTCAAAPLVAVAGYVGIRSGVGASNSNSKPVLFRYDDLELRSPRFSGEVSRWDPSRALGEVDRKVAVEVSAITRRLSQFKKPLRGSSYRHITTTTDFTVLDYWPLDEEPGASRLGENWVAGGAPAEFVQWLDGNSQLQGAIKYGTPATLLPGIDRSVELINAGELHLGVRSDSLGSTWTASWCQRIAQAAGARVRLRSTVAADDVIFTFYVNGNYLVEVGTGITFTTIFSGSLANPGYDDVWHTISFCATDSGGGTCTYRLSIDGDGPNSTALNPVTFGPLKRIEFQGGDINTSLPCGFGQVVVCPQDNGTNNIPNFLHIAASGHDVETALQRAERLGDEENVRIETFADPFEYSANMGPQQVATFLTLIDDAVAVERGSRVDPKGDRAIGFRTVASTVNQTAAATLAYTGGYVGDPFQPVTDDQGLINEVTAKRPNGGRATYERTIGPKNTSDPGTVAGAAGRSDGQITTNVLLDSDLPDQAEWRVNLSTVNVPRFPKIVVDLAGSGMTNALASQVMDVGIDDLLVVNNASTMGIYDDVRQIARGYTETLDTAYLHKIVFNCSPAEPYDPVILDSAVLAGSTDIGNPSTITAGVNSSATSLSVASIGYLWKTGSQSTAAMFDGEKVTITNVTGTSSPQTFTVTRSVNGVVKSHLSGAKIEVMNPVRLMPAPML